jgi:hypothetical protein
MDPSDFRNNVDGIAFASDAVHCVILFWRPYDAEVTSSLFGVERVQKPVLLIRFPRNLFLDRKCEIECVKR